MGVLLYLVHSEEGTGLGRSPPRSLLAVPNVTARTSTASVTITVLLYNGPFLCSFNVPIKGLNVNFCDLFLISRTRTPYPPPLPAQNPGNATVRQKQNKLYVCVVEVCMGMGVPMAGMGVPMGLGFPWNSH